MMRISAVSYLNTKPFLYGLFKSPLAASLDIQLDIPSVCAKKLQTGEADLALVPVAVIPELATPHIISDYCIGSDGPVHTVCLFSRVPLEEITHILLDFHSRTSVQLVQLLAAEYWHIQPAFVPSEEAGLEHAIKGTTAAVIIGDKTIGLHARYPYVYDLSEAWKAYTGLPFVFACWVANKPLSPDFTHAFNLALQRGLEEIPQLIYLLPAPRADFDLSNYFTHHISYHLDEPKRKALRRFLSYLTPDEKIIFEAEMVNTL